MSYITRAGAMGNRATKSTGTITGNPTTTLFNVTGGEVLITALYGIVGTALTTGGSYAVQANPSTGDTVTLVTATTLGGTDVTKGSILGLTRGTTAAPQFLGGGTAELGVPVTTGTIEFVGASSADGVITFCVSWIPLTPGAALVAA